MIIKTKHINFYVELPVLSITLFLTRLSGQSWDTLFWFAVLVGMSGKINCLDIIIYLPIKQPADEPCEVVECLPEI